MIAWVAAGCAADESQLEVAAFLRSGPLADLEITALPFDPDRILDSLTASSPVPKPEFPNLTADILVYRRPAAAELRNIGATWRATRDSVAHLADSLSRVSADSPGYARAYERLRRQYQRLARRAAERDAEYRRAVGEDRDLALRAAVAADSLRAWERSAYLSFPSLADSAVARSGRAPVAGVTDEAGWLELPLAPGSWWLIARLLDQENPFVERYWNVAVVVSRFGPAKIPLYEQNSSVRWHH